jgi:hypothetical protein
LTDCPRTYYPSLHSWRRGVVESPAAGRMLRLAAQHRLMSTKASELRLNALSLLDSAGLHVMGGHESLR